MERTYSDWLVGEHWVWMLTLIGNLNGSPITNSRSSGARAVSTHGPHLLRRAVEANGSRWVEDWKLRSNFLAREA